MAAALTLALGGCGAGETDGQWVGYFYDDLRFNGTVKVARTYDSARQCMADMPEYLKYRPRTAGFACGQGCTSEANGQSSGCEKVVVR